MGKAEGRLAVGLVCHIDVNIHLRTWAEWVNQGNGLKSGADFCGLALYTNNYCADGGGDGARVQNHQAKKISASMFRPIVSKPDSTIRSIFSTSFT